MNHFWFPHNKIFNHAIFLFFPFSIFFSEISADVLVFQSPPTDKKIIFWLCFGFSTKLSLNSFVLNASPLTFRHIWLTKSTMWNAGTENIIFIWKTLKTCIEINVIVGRYDTIDWINWNAFILLLEIFFLLLLCFAAEADSKYAHQMRWIEAKQEREKREKEHDSIGYFHLCIENVGFIKNPHVYKMIIILDLEIKWKKMNASSQQPTALLSRF